MRKDYNYFKKLRRVFNNEGIFPFSDYSSINAQIKTHHKYPLITVVGEVDKNTLLQEYKITKKFAWKNYIKKSVNVENIKKEFSKLGLDPEDYLFAVEKSGGGGANKSYHMLLDENVTVQSYTKHLIDDLAGFTPQYWWMKKSTYQLPWHIDYTNVDKFGYRILIPVTTPMYIAFYTDTIYTYKLFPGKVYRVNPTVLHRGFCNESISRVHLMLSTHEFHTGYEPLPETEEYYHPAVDDFWKIQA